jgi:hypothetical protein
MASKNKPGRYDGLAKAAPDEPYFVLLARDADAVPALMAWCRSRLQRIRAGDKPLVDLDQVIEAITVVRAMVFWRRHHPRPASAGDGIPSGVRSQRIDLVSQELAEFAGEITRDAAASWVCLIDGNTIGHAATKNGAIRLADYKRGDAVVRCVATGEEWRRIDGAWKPAAESAR